MSDLQESDFDMDEYSIWKSIENFCPPPAVQEIRYLLGSKLMDDNQSLWDEVEALYQILASCQENISILSTKSSKKFSYNIETTTTPSRISKNDQNIPSETPRREVTISQIIQSICNFDMVDHLPTTVREIRNAIMEENHELEEKITMLSEVINGEAEILHSRSTPRLSIYDSSQSSNSHSNNNNQNQSQSHSIRICSYCMRESLIEDTGNNSLTIHGKVSYTCALCKDMERKERKQIKSKPTSVSASMLISSSTPQIDPAGFSVEESTILSKEKTGKFRSRLQSARDEIYFFDG